MESKNCSRKPNLLNGGEIDTRWIEKNLLKIVCELVCRVAYNVFIPKIIYMSEQMAKIV